MIIRIIRIWNTLTNYFVTLFFNIFLYFNEEKIKFNRIQYQINQLKIALIRKNVFKYIRRLFIN